MGPIAWRQFKLAWRYSGSVAVALVIPRILAWLPLAVGGDPTTVFLTVLATVLFYSFVLLPEAAKFHCRLDSNHMAKLNMLLTGLAVIVTDQLAMPIVLGAAFQCSVLLVAGLSCAVSPVLVTGVMLLVVPVPVFLWRWTI